MSKNSLLKGATILSLAGILVKILGAGFRLPLVNWIGDIGMANYGPAYFIYALFVILAASGFPVAVSKLISESLAIKNYYQAHKIFKIASYMMVGLGSVFFIILFFFADGISALMKNEDAALGMKAMAPALILVPATAAFKGYFQGMQNMRPTAIVQIVEQIFRVIVGLGITYYMFFIALDENSSYSRYVRGAAGANFGATAGAIGGFIMMIFIYYLARPSLLNKAYRSQIQGSEDAKTIVKRILVISLPITLGAGIMPVFNLMDSAMVVNRLISAGFSQEIAKSLYGQLSGFVESLINLPQILTQSIGISLVPIIAAAYQVRNKEEIRGNTIFGLRLSMIISMPMAIGIMVLSKPILLLLYPRQVESATNAASVLFIMGLGVIFLSVTMTLGGVLQGVGKQMIPVKNFLIGLIFKIILTWVLVGIKPINIDGAAIGTVVAYIVGVTLNYKAVKRYTGIKLDKNLVLVRPMIASLVMGALAYLTYICAMMIVGKNSIATLLSIFVAVVVYTIMIFVTKSIKEDELQLIPKGEKIAMLVKKLKRS